MTNDFDLDKYKADQARARDLGFSYAELSSIINSAHNDGDDGISMGRAIEMIREIGLRAVDKAVAQERKNIVTFLREKDLEWDAHELSFAANSIEEDEHIRKENS